MERSSFFNAELINDQYDRTYNAEDFARYFASFIGSGIFPSPTSNLQVRANDGMSVVVSKGKAWINGYFYENTEDLTLNLATAHGVLKRIDRIVVRLDLSARLIQCAVKKGSESSSPTPPNLQRDSDIYELALADILVENGATKLTQSNITDQRFNNSLCGIVSGVVDQIDTTDLFTQFQSAFTIWFDAIKGQLSEDAAGNLQNQLNQVTSLLSESAIPNTIPIRDEYAQTKVDGVRFETREGEARGRMLANFNGRPAFVDYIANPDLINADNDEDFREEIWTNKSIPIESGTFTPEVHGTTSGKMTLKNAVGHYTRIGNIVNFHTEFTVWGQGNAVGNVLIAGLPFASVGGVGKSCVIGWQGGTFAGMVMTAYMTPGGSGIKLGVKNVASGSMGYVTVNQMINNGLPNVGVVLALSGTYMAK